ncbi:MAG: type IV secretion protein IcmJ [Gammaproteobacteria bacterium RIFCSPHIGHO2_12_FULL_35_23]|nr:MAG: type IV secretion protein IcmJ [Gammaproteobacteria bacterium RIFCSPHIGHO2_12_FULL_35_23]
MYPLELTVKLGNWTIFNGRKQDQAFLPVKEKVLIRDHYTCQFCGFQAQEHQEVINLDGNYRNNRFDNLVTACIFCAQCGFLEVVGSVYGGGKLIYLPEMTQTELNSFCHVLFCAMTNKTSYMNTAQTAYRNFRLRGNAVDEKFGENASEPNVFCQLILNNDCRPEKLNLFKDIRLLPSYARFKDELEDWAAAAVAELSQGKHE